MKKTLKSLIICSIFCFSYNTVSAQSYYNNTYQTVKSKCFATTKAGYSCSRNAKSGSSYCGQHGNKKRLLRGTECAVSHGPVQSIEMSGWK